MLKLKRIYDPYSAADGCRILVDRLWPQGVKKELAKIDYWPKEVAPSPELRVWFNHDPQKWDAFCKAYLKELEHSPALDELVETIKNEPKTTLLYAAKDKKHTHALVLFDLINKRI
ncbi:MAG: DUF488 family protein [Bacteroidota bacterium]